MNIRLPFLSSIRLTTVVVTLLSLLMAAYWPIAHTNAQAVLDINLAELKTEAIKEIDRRIDSYQKSLDSLNEDQGFTLGTSIKIMNPNGSFSTSASVSADDLGSALLLPQKIKDQSKMLLEAIIKQLDRLKEKVKSAKSLAEMKKLSKNIDAQFQLTQFIYQQTFVAKSINTMSDVFGKVQGIHGKLGDRVKALKDCFNLRSGANASPSASPNGSASPSEEDCEGLPFGSQDMLNNSQMRMEGIQSILSAISSILKSVVSLFVTIIQTLIGFVTGLFGSLTGSLGSLTSITGMLENLGNVGNLEGLLGSLGGGGLGGLSTALSSIPSQLSNALGMAGGASSLLGSANSFINFIPLGN